MDGPVVVGIDDFEHSDRLIATAAREAQLRGTALWLANAFHGYAPVTQGIPPGLTSEQILRDAVEEQLAQVAARTKAEFGDLHIETAALAGPAVAALAELANLDSLLVVGGRGRGGLSGQLLGSVSLGVLSQASCPVLVVRGDREQVRGRVMLGVDVNLDVDGSDTGPEVLEFAFNEAARRDASLYAFHAWEDPSLLYAYGTRAFPNEHRQAALERRRKLLDTILAPWREMHPKVPVSFEVLAGLPAKLLVESTELADLVVIGGKAHKSKDGMRVGAIAHTVLHHARCPVAIVPEH